MPEPPPEPPPEPGPEPEPKRRPESLPLLHLLPNLLTIAGLCAGLTAIRLVLAGRLEAAVALVVFAVVLDALDGLVARRLNAATQFGAELDSLADFVNFGVTPGLIVYAAALSGHGGPAWVFVLVYVICCCLRLARFNVSREGPPPPGKPVFTGVPSPAGAMLALLPVFAMLAGLGQAPAAVVAPYLAGVGLLMVSRLRTPSLKGLRVPRDKAAWVLVGGTILAGVAFTRFWHLLVLADLVYGAILVRAAVLARRRRAGHGD